MAGKSLLYVQIYQQRKDSNKSTSLIPCPKRTQIMVCWGKVITSLKLGIKILSLSEI